MKLKALKQTVVQIYRTVHAYPEDQAQERISNFFRGTATEFRQEGAQAAIDMILAAYHSGAGGEWTFDHEFVEFLNGLCANTIARKLDKVI